jgi:adenine-specific DNA methylase
MSKKIEYVGAEQLLLSRVLKQDSIALAFGGFNPMWLGWWLKVLGKTVHVNDILEFNYWDAMGMVENDHDTFSEEAIANLLEGIQNGESELENHELARLMSKEDAYFFDQLRPRLENLPPHLKGMAIRAGFNTIRYVQRLETNAAYGVLKQPLSKVFTKFLLQLNTRVTDNGQGHAYMQEANEFVKDAKAEVIYFDLPVAEGINLEAYKGELVFGPTIREIWTRGPSNNWLKDLRDQTKGKFGDKLLTRESYDQAFAELLNNASDYPLWVFNIQESEYPRILNVVKQFRKPKALHRFDGRGTNRGHMNFFLMA